MYNMASRSLVRRLIPVLRSTTSRRLISTAPPSQQSRSWKSSAVRWGLALGGIYYYNTSNVFADQPTRRLSIMLPSCPFNADKTLVSMTPPSTTSVSPGDDESSLTTLESIAASKRSKTSLYTESAQSIAVPETVTPEGTSEETSKSPEELEDEAGQQGAFNEETGEINWDCPCLGGMAHGPCGGEFRGAFSCFVYSKEEPKGMDCIEKFK